MAFNSTKSAGDPVLSADWNNFVDFTELISSNAYGHSSNADLHFPSSNLISWLDNVYAQSGSVFDGTNYITSANAISRFTDSSNVNISLINAISSNLDSKIDAISDTPTSWGVLTAGTGINTLTNVGVSGAGDIISIDQSSILTTVSSNAKSSHDWVDASSQRYEDLLGSGNKYSKAYASAQIALYSVGDISIEDLSDVAIMTPSDGKALIWDDTQSKWSSQSVSASDVAWSGASDFYNFSSNAKNLYHPSGLVISGQEYSQAYASAQRVKDLFDSSSYYNSTWIDSLSGSIDTRLDSLELQEPSSWSGATGYIGHSGNSDIHYPSSNIRSWLDNVYSPSASNVSPATYIIMMDGANTKAINGNTGEVEISSTDSALVIQHAMDAVGVLNGGLIHIREGSYYIDRTLWWDYGGLNICGDGANATILYIGTNKNCDMFRFSGASACYFFYMRDITLDGDNYHNTAGSGLNFESPKGGRLADIRLESIFVEDFYGDGIVITDSWGCVLDQCISEFNYGNGITYKNRGDGSNMTASKFADNNGYACVISGTTLLGGQENFMAVNCLFWNSDKAGLKIYTGPNDSPEVGNNSKFSNCIFRNNSKDGNDLYSDVECSSRNVSFIGCTFSSSKVAYNIDFDANAYGNIVTSCIFKGNRQGAINGATSDCLIHDNIGDGSHNYEYWSGATGFYGFSSNAKGLYHPSGLVISGQEYSQAYASAQIAIYSETYSSEGDLTTVLDDNYHPSGYVISGQEYSNAYASAQRVKDLFDQTLYVQSGTIWTALTDGGDITDTYHTHSQYGGGTSPGGGDHYVQYNNEGAFGGDSSLTWNDTTNTLRISGAISSASISGGTIKGTWAGDDIGYEYLDSLNTVSSNAQSAQDWILNTFSSNADIRYGTSSSAISKFADSSNYSTHKSDGDIHFPSSSIRPWLDAKYKGTGAALSATLAGDMDGNISGASYAYGFTDIDFVSSQSISGGSIVGDLHYPAEYIIYKVGATCYAKKGSDGTIVSSDTDERTVIQYAMDNGDHVYILPGTYQLEGSLCFADNTMQKTLQGSGKGTTLQMMTNDHCIVMSGARHCTVKDFYVYSNLDGYNKSIIYLNGKGTKSNQWNVFENIEYFDGKLAHIATLIRLESDDGEDSGMNCSRNTFQNIETGGAGGSVASGIAMYTDDGDTTYQNGNIFRNIWLSGFVTAVSMSNRETRGGTALGAGGQNRNQFIGCKFEAESYTKDGFKNISRRGNCIIDCFFWDKNVPDSINNWYGIHEGAEYTTILGTDDVGDDYYDSGSGTFAIWGGDHLQTPGVITNFVSSQTISGGTIKGTWGGDSITSEYITDYIASSVAVNKFYYQESDLTSVLNDNYPGSSNVNWTKITAISSGFDGRLDTLEAMDEFEHEYYITSSNAYAKFAYSSNINRTYVDTISSNLDAKIDAVSDTPTNWGTLTEGTGIAPITSVGVSGSGDHDVTVLGYTTISSNAQWAKNWLNVSGSQLSNFLASGDEYSTAYAERGSQIAGDNLTWNGSQLDATAGDATIAGDLDGNLSGASYTYGLKDIDFVSSQAISGGTIIGNLHYPVEYIIYSSQGDGYYAKNGKTGKIDYSDVSPNVVINSAITATNSDGGGKVYITPGTYYIDDRINLDSNIHLQGAGINETIIIGHADMGTGVIATSSKTFFTISDMTVDGESNVSRYSNVDIKGSADFILRDLHLKNPGCNAIRLYDDTHRGNISNIFCDNLGESYHGISVGGSGEPYVSNININNVLINDCVGQSLDFSNSRDITVNNVIINNSDGIKITAGYTEMSYGINLNNIDINLREEGVYYKQGGLKVQRNSDCNISNVTISGTGGYGIWIYSDEDYVGGDLTSYNTTLSNIFIKLKDWSGKAFNCHGYNTTITNLTISGNGSSDSDYPLHLNDGGYYYLDNINIIGNTSAASIVIKEVENVNLSNFNIYKGVQGIYILDSRYINISNGIIKNTSNDAIFIDGTGSYADYISIKNCYTSSAASGMNINLSTADNLSIIGNNFLDNKTGIVNNSTGSNVYIRNNIGSNIDSYDYISSQTISGGTIKGTWTGDSITSEYITDYIASTNAIQSFYQSSSGYSNYLHSSNNDIHLNGVSSPTSGQVAVYGADTTNATWQNVYPPLTYTLANTYISANQNWNLGKFSTPADKSAHVLQAYCCNSGGVSVGDLSVQMLSGTTLKYSCSSATLQQYSNPSSATGDLEFRFTYSGASNPTGYQYGNCLIQIGVW